MTRRQQVSQAATLAIFGMMALGILLFAGCMAILPVMAQQKAGQPAVLPNPALTPGAVLAVTSKDVCVAGYTKKVRNVPESVKLAVFREYKIDPKTNKPGDWEVDHLCPLTLGGSNSITNLWPQPGRGTWNFHQKDRLEVRMNHLVCAGKIPLTQAQNEIKTNWIAAYQKYLGAPAALAPSEAAAPPSP